MVRINSTTSAASYLDQVREQRGANEDRDADGRRHDSQGREKEEEPPYEATREQVERAAREMAQEMSNDEGIQSSGIQVGLEGVGPGLRVTLKGADGTVLRHMSGEEFMRLRESAREGAPRRGRLLDRKL